MAFVKLTQEGVDIRRRRFLISGEPNSRKTTSALTFPGGIYDDPTGDRRLVIVSYPGEKGYDTIPLDRPNIIPLIWQVDDAQRLDSHKIVDEVYSTSIKALADHRPVTFVGDGIHKFFDYVLDAVTDGAFLAGEEFEAKLYRKANDWFLEYLSRIMHTPTPIVVFTSWAEHEADRQKKKGEQASDIPSHIYPAIPGKGAKRIMGEFSVVVHQTIGKIKPTDAESQELWQTRPYGEVWGCGLKGPKDTVKHIPTFIPANYRVFEQAWAWAEKQAASGADKSANKTEE